MVNTLPHRQESEWLDQGGMIWPDGWYLYQDGKTSGPYRLEELFRPQNYHTSSHPKWAARNDFEKWYDLNFLYSKVLYPQSTYGHGPKRIITEPKRIRPKIELEIAKLSKNQSSKIDCQAEQLKINSLTLPRPNFQKAPKENLLKTIDRAHLINRGRLRLGRVRPILQHILCKFFFTAGFYWFVWLRQVSNEVFLHLDIPAPYQKKQKMWKAYIPIMHMFACYRLSRLVLQMEVQNGYKTISPFLAFWLSFVPPLYMIYIQRAINKHWFWHSLYCIEKN